MTKANVLDRFLDPFGAFLTPEVAQRLVDFRVDEQTQAHIDALADKCTEGQLMPAEREEYDTYIDVFFALWSTRMIQPLTSGRILINSTWVSRRRVI